MAHLGINRGPHIVEPKDACATDFLFLRNCWCAPNIAPCRGHHIKHDEILVALPDYRTQLGGMIEWDLNHGIDLDRIAESLNKYRYLFYLWATAFSGDLETTQCYNDYLNISSDIKTMRKRCFFWMPILVRRMDVGNIWKTKIQFSVPGVFCNI